MNKAVKGLMWVGRTTVFTVGLAVTVALMVGVATTALAAVPGDPFKLGKINAVDAASVLVGSVNGAMLTIENNAPGSRGAPAPALSLDAQSGNPPLIANPEAGTATNFSADELDGLDQGAFLRANGKAADANLLDGKDSSAYVPADTYSVVDSRPGQGGGQIASRGASCDPGDMVLTGGYSSGLDDNLLASGPDGTRKWFAAVQDNGLDSLIRAEAICADFPPLR